MNIIDTGPIFKFLSVGCASHLISALGGEKINVPEAVSREIIDTPNRHHQFKPAVKHWKTLQKNFVNVLDDGRHGVEECCKEVFGQTLEELMEDPEDSGEEFAILHGVLEARAGEDVVIICDDEGGRADIERVAKEHSADSRYNGGSIKLADTLMLLEWAIQNGAFKSRKDFLTKYKLMSELDSALPRKVKDTGLTTSPPWDPEVKN